MQNANHKVIPFRGLTIHKADQADAINQQYPIETWSHNCPVFGLVTLGHGHECSVCDQTEDIKTARKPIQFSRSTYRPCREFSRKRQEYLLNRHRLVNWKNKLNQAKEIKA